MFHIGIAVQHPPLPDPSQLSELGIDFIRQCLTIDPDKRPTAAEMNRHPWISLLNEQLGVTFEEETGSSAGSAGGSLGWNSMTTASSLGGALLEEEEEEEEKGGYNGDALEDDGLNAVQE